MPPPEPPPVVDGAIVVPNTFWTAVDPTAYEGGRPPTITRIAQIVCPCCGYRAFADASFEYGPLPAELTATTL